MSPTRTEPGRLIRLNTVNTSRTTGRPRPRLKPRGLPRSLEPHEVYDVDDPAQASIYGRDLWGDHRIEVTGPGEFAASYHGVLVRDVTLGYLDYSTAVRVQVAALTDDILVGLPAIGASMVMTGDQMVETSPVQAFIGQSGRSLVMTCSEPTGHLIVRIDRRAIETHLSRLLGHTVDQPLRFAPGFDLSTGAGSRWNLAVQMVQAELLEPDSLIHRGVGVGAVEEFLMSALLYSQASNYQDGLVGASPQVSPAVLAAIDYIDRHLTLPMTVGEVAEAVDLSVRSLQNQFRTDLHQTPTNYIRSRRLDRARSDLADANPASGATVTDIASRWGFTHLGRFSVVYKSRFGESPSQTLRS